MTCDEVVNILSEFADGELDQRSSAAVTEHVRTCPGCAKEYQRILSLKRDLRSLPASMLPSRDLWTGIAPALNVKPTSSRNESVASASTRLSPLSLVWRVAAVFVAVVGGFLAGLPDSNVGWNVQRLVGQTAINGEYIENRDRLIPGEELVTESGSTAEVEIADIGTALVLPGSRLRIMSTSQEQHRLQLSLGSIRASVWSPPRVFVVETPTAVAVDLGCSYDLAVDSTGATRLLVTGGEVSLESASRWSIVMAGYICETRPGYGPGTPYLMDSDPAIVSLLHGFDFGEADPSFASRLSRLATRDEATTLVHLLMRTRGETFDTLFTVLSRFYAPPEGVTREGLLARDKQMFETWLNSFAYRTSQTEKPML